MADNKTLPATGTGTANIVVATRTVTYSGDAADVQVVGIGAFAGSDDAKTVVDVPAGGGVEATALRVTIASDSTGVLSVRPPKPATPTLSNTTASVTSVTVLASNAARLGAMFTNDSNSVAYVKFGSTASTTSHTVKMIANAYYEVPFAYTGIITAIWVSANGAMRATELTA